MADQPTKPVTEQLAAMRGVGMAVGAPFVELLSPSDPILMTRGRDYTLYRETLRDDQCASSFSDRRLAVTSKEWAVDAASESPLDVAAADFVRDELHRIDFDRLTDFMLYARWYGHAVAECMWRVDGALIRIDTIKVRNRSRFAYDNEGGVYLLTQAGQWERMPDRKFWTVNVGADNDDEPYGLGLAHYCYWPVFFKRNNLKFWLTFSEKFGTPTAMGKLPIGKYDNVKLREQVLDALLQFSSETAIVVPEETAVELLEAKRSGTATYDELHDRMDASLAKLIIGQTASSQGTPGRLGNDDLQGQVRDDLVKADADLVCASFNAQVVKWLCEWNFPGAIPPRVWRKIEPEEDLKEAAETDTAIKALGFQPDEEYVQGRYGSHWKKAEPLNLGAGQPGAFGAQPNASPIDAVSQFADMGALGVLKAGKRANQQALADAAQYLASRGADAIGQRLETLFAYAAESGDYETLQTHLVNMAQELPPVTAVETVRNASVVSRLLGMLKGRA